MTPEAKVKKRIKLVIEHYRVQNNMYYFMSVPTGYGKSTVDYLGFLYGFGFAIEAKGPKGKPTARQLGTIKDIEAAGAAVFVINDEDSLSEFERWCRDVCNQRNPVR